MFAGFFNVSASLPWLRHALGRYGLWACACATIGERRVYLVNRAEGSALAAGERPWRLVVPGDRRPARWSRQVVRIVVADAP